jgi:SAM-dependent methyltransferase
VIDSNDVQAHITGFWSTVAADYDAHAGNVAEHGSVEYRRWVDVLASVVPDPPGDVLDVATGTGYVALAAASIGQRVTAIDLAPAMLEELVANATARSLTVDARLGDAVAPDFAPASFDAVTSRHLLWTLREPARAMVNWRRLLRPGGRLVAVDGFWFTEWDDEDVPALFAEHYTTGTRRELPFMHLDGPEPILKLLTAGGFMEVAAEPRPDLGPRERRAVSHHRHHTLRDQGPRRVGVRVGDGDAREGKGEGERRAADHAHGCQRSRISLSFCSFLGSALFTCRRRTSGTRSLPIPCPVKSRAIVTRDRVPPSSGSIMPLAVATSGPLFARTSQVRGGAISVISSVVGDLRGPTRRTTTVFEPTASGAVSSRYADATPSCHSGNRNGSTAYEKTSSGLRDISILLTIAAILPPCLDRL